MVRPGVAALLAAPVSKHLRLHSCDSGDLMCICILAWALLGAGRVALNVPNVGS